MGYFEKNGSDYSRPIFPSLVEIRISRIKIEGLNEPVQWKMKGEFGLSRTWRRMEPNADPP
jgi:hypothetical protein